MTDLKVKKKNGSVEAFNKEKLTKSLKSAGMESKENIEKVTTAVTGFVKGNSSKGPVETTKIRGKVLEQMRQVNNNAAKKFENYSKPS